MRLQISIFAGLALLAATNQAQAQSQTTGGYDAQGRLQCVRRTVDGGTRTTTYGDYDLAGNRQTMATGASGSCPSAGGAPPSPPSSAPGLISVTSLVLSATSGGSQAVNVADLGSSASPGSIYLMGALTQGATGTCGQAAFTATVLTFTAPVLENSNPVVCRVSYALIQPSTSARRTGQIIFNVSP